MGEGAGEDVELELRSYKLKQRVNLLYLPFDDNTFTSLLPLLNNRHNFQCLLRTQSLGSTKRIPVLAYFVLINSYCGILIKGPGQTQ